MKILYDSSIFDIQSFGGASKCFCEVINHLPDNVEWELALKTSKNVHLNECGLFRNNSFRQTYHQLKYLVKNLGFKKPILANINRDYSISRIRKGNYDVMHHTFSDPYFLKYINKPYVYTIHDMTPEIFPQWFNLDESWIKCKSILCEYAAHIVAISENTKQDAINILGIDPNRISVVHHGGPSVVDIVGDSLIDCPYFLFVGTRSRYKNFEFLLDVFAEIHRLYPDILLVCTGASFSDGELARMKHLGLDTNVRHLFVSDANLKILYKYSLAFIFPSLNEGFGLPILESYACGCPVILSRVSCFPEIGGDAAIYFDTNDSGQSLFNAMLDIINLSKTERNRLIARGYDRLNSFTWERSALGLTEVYKSVL